jgi:vacuolar-type H+-ATPase subunit H
VSDHLEILTEHDDTESILTQLFTLVESAKSMPMSTSVRVERDEVLDMIDLAVQHLPEEIRSARWLLKEKEEFRARARREADEIIATAARQAGDMVSRQELVLAAERRAEAIIDEAESEARRLTREAEDYCDQKLGSFEATLDRLQRTVAAGRRKLKLTTAELEFASADADEPGQAFFDQGLDDEGL